MEYIILYVLILILGNFYLLWKEEIFIKGLYFILILFSGFRYKVGVDFDSYVSIYERIKNNDGDVKKYIEYGYIFLNKIIININGTAQIVFLIMAFISNILIFKFIREEFIFKSNKEKYIVTSTYIFFLIGAYYISGFNGVRQFLTIAIYLYSYKYIKKRKLLKYVFFIIIGSFFHKSILFLFPLYWILNFEKLKLKTIFILIFLNIIITLNLNIIIKYIPFYNNYSIKNYQFSTSYILLIGLLFINILLIYFHKKLMLSKYEYNISIICILFLIIIIFNKNLHPGLNLSVMRMSSYFYFFNITTIPKLLFYFKRIFKIPVELIFFLIISILYFKTTLYTLKIYEYNIQLFF